MKKGKQQSFASKKTQLNQKKTDHEFAAEVTHEKMYPQNETRAKKEHIPKQNMNHIRNKQLY